MKKLLLISIFLGFENIFSKDSLNKFAFNTFSQFGEDGIIQKIYELIGEDSKICLEVGAGDGVDCSNVANLWKNYGWKAILIEKDAEKYRRIEQNTKGYDCLLVSSYIEKDEKTGPTIDSIIDQLGIKNLDLLSLDIDGNEYYIFENLKIHPRVLIIEFNPSIPYYRDVYQAYSGHSWEFGCSIASLIRIGKEKGYELVALTNVNAIFVDNSYVGKFVDYETSVERIFNTDYLKNLAITYNGEPIVIAKLNYLVDRFGRKGYSKEPFAQDCYYLRINDLDLNQTDYKANFKSRLKD
jgi:hypothetical protein